MKDDEIEQLKERNEELESLVRHLKRERIELGRSQYDALRRLDAEVMNSARLETELALLRKDAMSTPDVMKVMYGTEMHFECPECAADLGVVCDERTPERL